MVMFFWGARVYVMAFKEAPDALDIHVIGKQWMWKIQHPSGRREIKHQVVNTDIVATKDLTLNDGQDSQGSVHLVLFHTPEK